MNILLLLLSKRINLCACTLLCKIKATYLLNYLLTYSFTFARSVYCTKLALALSSYNCGGYNWKHNCLLSASPPCTGGKPSCRQVVARKISSTYGSLSCERFGGRGGVSHGQSLVHKELQFLRCSLHCALSCGAVYCNRPCLCVCGFVMCVGLLPR